MAENVTDNFKYQQINSVNISGNLRYFNIKRQLNITRVQSNSDSNSSKWNQLPVQFNSYSIHWNWDSIQFQFKFQRHWKTPKSDSNSNSGIGVAHQWWQTNILSHASKVGSPINPPWALGSNKTRGQGSFGALSHDYLIKILKRNRPYIWPTFY